MLVENTNVRQIWLQTWTLPLTGSVTLEKLVGLPESQFTCP